MTPILSRKLLNLINSLNQIRYWGKSAIEQMKCLRHGHSRHVFNMDANMDAGTPPYRPPTVLYFLSSQFNVADPWNTYIEDSYVHYFSYLYHVKYTLSSLFYETNPNQHVHRASTSWSGLAHSAAQFMSITLSRTWLGGESKDHHQSSAYFWDCLRFSWVLSAAVSSRESQSPTRSGY